MSLLVHLPLSETQSFLIHEHHYSRKNYPYHYHPEYELTLVLKSHGLRFVGDSIRPYEVMDLVLLGPNLPHQWRLGAPFMQEGGEQGHIIVVHVRQDFLGEGLSQRIEMHPILDLLRRSVYGLAFQPDTAHQVLPLLREMLVGEATTGFINLLEVLYLLSQASEFELLASPAFIQANTPTAKTDITEAVQYVLNHFEEELTASSMAARMDMKLSAFSHYFKTRTTKSFIRFLNEVRLGHAARLLTETDLKVAEICFQVGFRNLSNFNRQFKAYYQQSPLQYKKQHIEP